MKRMAIVALLSLCCFAGACSRFPQETPPVTASIAGRAFLTDGQPVEGADVSVRHTRPDGSSVALFEARTDKGGRFSATNMPAGKKLWISVTKMYPGKMLYTAGVHATLGSGEARQLPDLKGGLMHPPLATPENAHLLE